MLIGIIQFYLMKTSSGGQFVFTRSATGNFSTSTPMQPEKRKIMNNLEMMLKEQIEKRQFAQKQLMQYRERSLMIERQFSRLLQKYDNHVAMLNGRESYSQQIWSKLVNEIEKFNDNSQKMLEKRCDQILFMMGRRINEIVQKMEQEVIKNKKLSEDEYKQIKDQIKEALKLARDIQVQNQQMKRVNKDLNFKIKVLREERNLLVEQLCLKKMVINKLAKNNLEESRQNSISSPKTISRNSRIIPRKSSTNQETIPRFFCEPSMIEINSSMDNPQLSKRLGSVDRPRQKDLILKTDNHIKICLQRERRKNAELKAIIVKLQSKNRQINLMIDRTVNQMNTNVNQKLKVQALEKLIQNVSFKMMAGNSKEIIGLSQDDFKKLMEN